MTSATGLDTAQMRDLRECLSHPLAVKGSRAYFVDEQEFIRHEVKLLRRPALLCYVSPGARSQIGAHPKG